MIRRYPLLVDGAFVIITWVGLKLLIEYAHAEGWVHFEIPKWLSLGLIVVIFGDHLRMARRQGPVEDEEPIGRLTGARSAAFLLRVEDGAHQLFGERAPPPASFSRAQARLPGVDHRRVLFEIGPAVAAPIEVHLERCADLGIQLAAQVIGEEVRAGTAGEFLHQLRSPQPRGEQRAQGLPGAVQPQLDGVRA